jgi:antitoxin MazE
MIKKLTKVGNSLALVIDRPILDLLNVDDQTPLEIRTDGHALTITPASESDEDAGRKRKIALALGRVNQRYVKALKRLAK